MGIYLLCCAKRKPLLLFLFLGLLLLRLDTEQLLLLLFQAPPRNTREGSVWPYFQVAFLWVNGDARMTCDFSKIFFFGKAEK